MSSSPLSSSFLKSGKPPAGSSLREINKLQEALSALPQFQETKARYNLHTDLCSMCIQEFSNRQLSMISGLEQELATGENNEGRATKVFIRSLIEVLDNQSIG